MDPLLDVVKVEARKDFTLLLEFEGGDCRVFDMKPFLDRSPFRKLTALSLFMQASIEFGTVVWPGDLDIAPETLLSRSTPVV